MTETRGDTQTFTGWEMHTPGTYGYFGHSYTSAIAQCIARQPSSDQPVAEWPHSGCTEAPVASILFTRQNLYLNFTECAVVYADSIEYTGK